ncbi:MAG: fumarate hydratase [Armatimonadetes bacterium]|nr:fumarate hydratase [Armatimonadota bacterium]
MKEINTSAITDAVAQACISACYDLPPDIEKALERGMADEESPTGRDVLGQIIENARIASEESVPICQDTGFAVVFIRLGQDAHIVGGSLTDAINEGVRRGYSEGYLRKSIVAHPLERVNTGDNTPAVIHTEIKPGDEFRIMIAPKGGGSENMSGVRMLKPSDGVEGVKKFVVDLVKSAGSNPCPPIIVGVGIGGTMEMAAIMAKRAVIREVGRPSEKPYDAALEQELLRLVNDTGVGPAGLGGRVTALAVNVESYPAHIASLPVAVNIQCHAARHKEIVL